MRAPPSQGSNHLCVMDKKPFSSNAMQSQRIFNSVINWTPYDHNRQPFSVYLCRGRPLESRQS